MKNPWADDSRQDFSLSVRGKDSKVLVVVKEEKPSLLAQSLGYDFSIPVALLGDVDVDVLVCVWK